ncbi:hypothetical protein ACFJYA_13955 [Enterococcus faecalis]
MNKQQNNAPSKRSSLMPESTVTSKTNEESFKETVKRNRIPEPASSYNPQSNKASNNTDIASSENTLKNDTEYQTAKESDSERKEELAFQLALNDYQTGRTMIGVQRMQKVEYDALLELYSDQYAYNYELLGAMLDEMINNLTSEQRFEFQDIVQKKKQRLIAKFKKEYKK